MREENVPNLTQMKIMQYSTNVVGEVLRKVQHPTSWLI